MRPHYQIWWVVLVIFFIYVNFKLRGLFGAMAPRAPSGGHDRNEMHLQEVSRRAPLIQKQPLELIDTLAHGVIAFQLAPHLQAARSA